MLNKEVGKSRQGGRHRECKGPGVGSCIEANGAGRE